MLLVAEYESGNFAGVVCLRPQIMLGVPRSRGGFYVETNGKAEAERLGMEASLDAITAFALAATGRTAEATALVASVRQKIAVAAAPPPPRADGKPAKKRDLERNRNMQPRAAEALRAIDEAERLVRLLAIADRGDFTALEAELAREKLPLDPAGIEIMARLAKNGSPDATEIAAAHAEMKASFAAARTLPPIRLEDLYDAAPEAEARSRVPKYKNAKNFLGENTGNGFQVGKGEWPGSVMIDFGGIAGSSAIVEEMALLHAADMARSQGKSGIIVLSQQTYVRTLTTYGMYGGGTTPQGYSAEVHVAFVDGAALPANLQSSPSRVLGADQVYRDLAAIYLEPASSTAATQ